MVKEIQFKGSKNVYKVSEREYKQLVETSGDHIKVISSVTRERKKEPSYSFFNKDEMNRDRAARGMQQRIELNHPDSPIFGTGIFIDKKNNSKKAPKRLF